MNANKFYSVQLCDIKRQANLSKWCNNLVYQLKSKKLIYIKE